MIEIGYIGRLVMRGVVMLGTLQVILISYSGFPLLMLRCTILSGLLGAAGRLHTFGFVPATGPGLLIQLLGCYEHGLQLNDSVA